MGKALTPRSGVLASARRTFGWFALGVSFLALCPLGASAESLEDALVAAYNTNPDLQQQRAQLRAIDEGVPQARAGWLPTVIVSGSYGYTERKASPSFAIQPFQQLHPVVGQVVATQPLFTGGQTYYSLRRAKAEVRAGEAELRTAEQTVLLSVVTAYMNVIRDEGVVEVTRNNVEVLKRQLQATRDRFQVGELTRTDVAQAEARLAGAISSLIQAEANLTVSRAEYERVVGHAPGSLAPPPPLPDLPTAEQEALAVGLREHPALVAARERETSSRFQVAIAKGALLPQIELQASLTHDEEQSIPAAQSDEKSLVAQFRMPLYQGGLEWSRIREAKQLNSQSLLAIAGAERGVVEGVSNAWEQLRAARAQIESDQEQVRANEIAFEGVRQEAQVGARTTLDVLDAEQELLNARVSLITSQRNGYVAAYQLIASTGRLSATQLQLPVTVYDPGAYYRKVNFKFIGWDIN